MWKWGIFYDSRLTDCLMPTYNNSRLIYNNFEKTPRPFGLGMNHAVAF